MPLFRRSPAAPTQPLEPAEWRPQPYGRVNVREVRDPIVEPAWSGVRVLVRLRPSPSGHAAGAKAGPKAGAKRHGASRPALEAVITDEEGIDCSAEFADVAAAIVEAARVQEAIMDGFLTIEPTQTSVGLAMPMPQGPTASELMQQMVVGGRHRRPEPAPVRDESKPIAFVAVDLLSVDDTRLIDLPLLERKRLLDGIVEQSELVRITPFAVPPIGSLALTWKAHGFRELVYKPANGRYRPTGEPGDWAVVRIRTR